jgi:hypothetical protein
MSPRALRITLVVAALVLLLFAGRWTAGLVADRWWAAELSPEAMQFVTEWAVLRLVLELGGVLFACAWFVGHLLLVYRAIGSVLVHRRLANLEIREAVNLRALAGVSVVAGLLLGLLTGRGVAGWTPAVVMGWAGPHVGATDPLLGHDIGFYLAELPLWRLIHGFAILLILLALGGVATLYWVIGAIRSADRQVILNDQARLHLGGLLVLLGAMLAWGYLLEPAELVAGVIGTVHTGLFDFRAGAAVVLTTLAIIAALLSGWWAVRGRNLVLGAAWVLLAAASLLSHHILPALIGPEPGAALEPAVRRQFDQLGYGMSLLRDSALGRRDAPLEPPRPVALWEPTLAALATASDSGRVVAVDRAVVPVMQRPRPAWLVVRDQAARGASVTVLLDDHTTAPGHPVTFTDPDSLRTAAGAPALRLPPRAVWPRARGTVVDSVPRGGVLIGSGLRRLTLAWALQSAALLRAGTERQFAYWHLDPVERLEKLVPYAAWGAPSPRLIGGDLVWLVDGYLANAAFPATSRVRWQGRWVGSLRVAFLGVVQAESGETRVYLRHAADELAKEWQALFDGMIEPASATPPEVVRAQGYPQELLETQLRVLAQNHWGLGSAIGHGEQAGPAGPARDATWEEDTSGVQQIVPFQQTSQRHVSSVVRARMRDGWETLTVLRVDSILALADPASLQTRWGRFPTFQQLRDSVEKTGGRVEPGPIRFWLTSQGLGAYQVHVARHDEGEPVLVWVSLATPEHRGAGHDLQEAWQNMLGLSAPIISAGARGTQLLEARRHLDAADQALKRGDLEAFGRAWEALRRTLRSP